MTEDEVRDLAMFISVDIEGTVHIEASLPPHTIQEETNGNYKLDLPIPRSVAPKIGRALLEANDAYAGLDGGGVAH